MPHRFAALTAATALGIGLLGAGTAVAADKPVVGTTECTAAVNGTSAVSEAKATLDAAKNELQTRQNELALARVAVPFLQANVDLLLATINDDTVSVAAAQRAYDRTVTRATRALCVAAVVETTTPTPTSTPTPTTEPTAEPTTTASADSTTTLVVVTVDPTADDGSVATTSGRQVTVVPEGSAQTGEA